MFLSIRPEMPADVPAIHAVTVAASLNAPHSDHTEQFIVDALRASGVLSISLVAEESGAVVGHVAVSPISISDGAVGWFGLGPISVSPKKQGRGIGSRLMSEVQQVVYYLVTLPTTRVLVSSQNPVLSFPICRQSIFRRFRFVSPCLAESSHTMKHSAQGAKNMVRVNDGKQPELRRGTSGTEKRG